MTTPGRIRRRRPWARRLAVLVVVGLALLLGVGGWLGVRGVAAAGHLRAARTSLLSARTALDEGRFADARVDIEFAGNDTAAARRLTADRIWGAVAAVPVAGNTLTTARGLARAADQTARVVLPHVMAALDGVDPTALRHRNRANNPALLAQLSPVLKGAAAQARTVAQQVAALPGAHVAGPVERARVSFQAQLQQLSEALTAIVQS